jgi:MinD superfamily P-loop ATPase
MIITVASGKGGTGKTTVAVSLALCLLENDSDLGVDSPVLLDCDVEEPNAALFLKPEIDVQKDVALLIPEVDMAACTYCGVCADVCRYNAITVVGEKVLVYPDLCHGCGSCTLNCPEACIEEVVEVLGVVERGRSGELSFGQGILQVGKAMSPPIIRELKQWALPKESNGAFIVLDAPPGASCPVVETMRESDFALLVTEPTPFGLHDLRLAVQLSRDELHLPVGVVINRDGIGDKGVEDFCTREKLPILMRIPYQRQIAEAGAEGIPLIQAIPEYQSEFRGLFTSIKALLQNGVEGEGGEE